MKKNAFLLLPFFWAGLPLALFTGMVTCDLLQIVSSSNHFAFWSLWLHVLALGASILLSTPKILRYVVTLPSYNKRKSKETMSFAEVLCTVAVVIFAVALLFRWASILPLSALIWPEIIALIVLLLANKKRFVFAVRFFGNTVQESLKYSVDTFSEASHEEAA